MAMVTKKSHLLKTLTWRIPATITTALVGWAVTGNPTTGLAIGGIEFFIKMPVYYFNERLWYKTKFGIKNENN